MLQSPLLLTGTPFHVLSIQGPPKTAKSHLAYGAPGKVAVYSSDGGWDGVVQKFEEYTDRFSIGQYYMPSSFDVDMLFRESDAERGVKEAAAERQADKVMNELWRPFKRDYVTAMADPEVRSHVLDLADEFNDMLRIATFGKVEQNPQIRSGPVNQEYTSLLRLAHQHRKNLVLVHRVGQKYKTVSDANTGREKSVAVEGETKRRGNDSVGYLVHSYVETFIQPAVWAGPVGQQKKISEQRFFVRILTARLNPAANGQVLEAPDWPTLMMFLAPDVPVEAWQ